LRPLTEADFPTFDDAEAREWLCANGQGAFAMGTVSNAAARRYHALLIAALPSPHGRMAVLGKVDETLAFDAGSSFDLSSNRYGGGVTYPEGWRYIATFAPWPVPTWTFALPNGAVIVKRVYVARNRNTVYVTYERGDDTAGTAQLTLTPLACWKPYHAEMQIWPGFPYAEGADADGWTMQATPDAPVLRLQLPTGSVWRKAGWTHDHITHLRECERGFACEESLYCPAVGQIVLPVGKTVAFVATVEDGPVADAQEALAEIGQHQFGLVRVAEATGAARDEAGRDLVLASDQFVIRTPSGRPTLLAGYPWFTDWGRDTMISLPGICLATGRFAIAREILEGFAPFVSDGMIPNRFPDAGDEPDYNTCDATLWYVRACDAYVQATGDTAFQARLLPTLQSIIEWHLKGARYGIGVDASDGLLRAGEAQTQLTWMDAKVGDWVVTPRTGKPVEINALWIAALRVAARWSGDDAYAAHADRAAASFREKFIRPDGLGLYDVIGDDGAPDAAIRPNQIIAAALADGPLTPDEAAPVVAVVERELLTPHGLRTLAPSDPAYKGVYRGGPMERDGAYHQGTVWPYLLGPFADAFRRVHGSNADVSSFLAPLLEAMGRDYGVGGVAEIFDGDAPHKPNGCPFQAWSVGELLRVRSS